VEEKRREKSQLDKAEIISRQREHRAELEKTGNLKMVWNNKYKYMEGC